jgi:uracil-DNA glycosylase family 4
MFLREIRRQYPTYYARPVPSFGVSWPRLLIVGLAPGLHGANRTGRPFTGDSAGQLLYRTLYRFGLASRPYSLAADDELRLIGCRITNAVRCVPPQNKPTAGELVQCSGYLKAELEALQPRAAILALGKVAHTAVLAACGLQQAEYRFAHGAEHALPGGAHLFDSYHCSRYNTHTGRLSEGMFAAVLARIADHFRAPRKQTRNR